ncbi:MAG: MBL fold metallo-hydrolase [Planctomycetia bacterium]|nr:MBL fold metallo-hydrolase [Planctomycetia bacterium]
MNTGIVTVLCDFFGMNSYLLHTESGGDLCIVVDAGMEASPILEELRRRNWRPEVILLTHGHMDHICGVPALREAFPEAKVGIGVGDAEFLTSAAVNMSAGFGFPVTLPPADFLFHDGDVRTFAGIPLEIRQTAGHTPGHVSYILPTDPVRAMVGDTIFQGSVGRTDFPGGDTGELYRSIREKLYTLPDSAILYPGHGPVTTVGEEKRTNPFVKGGV